MKKSFLPLLLLSILTACQKNNNPAPQSTQYTSNNSNNNANDTIGKTKVFYSIQLSPLTIGYNGTGRDYLQDTTNVRIYHNNKQLHNHFLSMGTSPNALGLNILENGTISSLSHSVTPLWCSTGDSIVVVFDSLEVNVTTAAQTERFQRTIVKITQNGSTTYNFDTYQYSNWASILNPYYTATGNSNRFLGTTIHPTSALTQNWFIGGQFRLVYHIQ
jgi:hypothetical protein